MGRGHTRAHGSAAHEPACPTHRRGGVNMPSPVSAHALAVRLIRRLRRSVTDITEEAVSTAHDQHLTSRPAAVLLAGWPACPPAQSRCSAPPRARCRCTLRHMCQAARAGGHARLEASPPGRAARAPVQPPPVRGALCQTSRGAVRAADETGMLQVAGPAVRGTSRAPCRSLHRTGRGAGPYRPQCPHTPPDVGRGRGAGSRIALRALRGGGCRAGPPPPCPRPVAAVRSTVFAKLNPISISRAVSVGSHSTVAPFLVSSGSRAPKRRGNAVHVWMVRHLQLWRVMARLMVYSLVKCLQAHVYKTTMYASA